MQELISTIRDFNRFYVNLLGILKNNVLNLEYSLTESRILYEIGMHQQITARELKALLTIDEGYLSRLIGNLVKNKHVMKVQSKTDKRAHDLSLTAEGQSLLIEINEKSDEQIKQLLENLSNKDKKRMTELMTELKKILMNTTDE